MIYFMQEDKYVYRVWQHQNYADDKYKIICASQFVQIKMVCELLGMEMMEIHYVNPSFA